MASSMAEPDRMRRDENHGLTVVAVSAAGPALEGDEKVEGQYENVQLVVGDGNDLEDGTLFITTRKIVWARQGSQEGLSARFLAISLHAVAQSNIESRMSCIYIQWEPSDSQAGSDSEDEDDCHELRLIPQDQSSVSKIFDILSQAAALNPDESDDDEEEGDFYYDQEEALQAGNLDESMLDHLDSLITMPRADELNELLAEDPERFEDADEDEELENGQANGHSH